MPETKLGWFALIFAWQFFTGIGIPPLPEEVTIVWAGGSANPSFYGELGCNWWLAWPTCIVAIILADLVLYSIGRYWGGGLFEKAWFKRFVSPELRLKLERGFLTHGVKILITARLLPLPGIRTAVFLTAGSIKYPFFRFFMADIIYAIPGVGFFFFCGYFSATALLKLYETMNETLFWIFVPAAIAGAAFLIHYYLRKRATPHLDRPPRLSDLIPHGEERSEETTEPESGDAARRPPSTDVTNFDGNGQPDKHPGQAPAHIDKLRGR